MTRLDAIKSRILQVLEDASGSRYSDALIEESLRLALDELNRCLPCISRLEITVTTAGRDQTLTGMEDCLYIVSLSLAQNLSLSRELALGSEFTFTPGSGSASVHFCGRDVPVVGDLLRVEYAHPYTFENSFGSATVSGILPASYESMLVEGAAGQACLLRATHLIEAYGARSEESPRLFELAKFRLEAYEAQLSRIHLDQDFGFPPGFALDRFDQNQQGRFR